MRLKSVIIQLALLPLLALLFSCLPNDNSGGGADLEMDRFVGDLMDKMTMEEKIGQINLVSVGFDVTGPRVSEDVEEKIVKGQVGGVFNTYTPVAVRKLQELAVTKSRLGIPLLFLRLE